MLLPPSGKILYCHFCHSHGSVCIHIIMLDRVRKASKNLLPVNQFLSQISLAQILTKRKMYYTHSSSIIASLSLAEIFVSFYSPNTATSLNIPLAGFSTNKAAKKLHLFYQM